MPGIFKLTLDEGPFVYEIRLRNPTIWSFSVGALGRCHKSGIANGADCPQTSIYLIEIKKFGIISHTDWVFQYWPVGYFRYSHHGLCNLCRVSTVAREHRHEYFYWSSVVIRSVVVG